MIRYKQLIAPFVAVIFIILQNVLGVDFGDDVQNSVAEALANLVAVGAVIYGIIKNNVVEKEKK